MPKKRLSPRQKKDHEYQRDTRVVAEVPKAYRISKPRKKRVANHRNRRRMDQLMDRALREESKPRSTITNMTWPLGKFIEIHKERRQLRAFRKVRKKRGES